MPKRIRTPGRTAEFYADSDAVGPYIKHLNGVKEYFLTAAITANVTTTTAASGSWGRTSHATGNNKSFVSDGAKWQAA
jgi:hypothetical protein